MVASQVHLVRHGEVFNPDGILYGRLPGFGLSKLGHRMAQSAADELRDRGRPVTALRVSPLQRTRESARPVAAAFDLEPVVDDRIIEPTNRFEGTVMRRALKRPANWPFLVNPARPSWGEAYTSIESRMLAAIDEAFDSVPDGDVVLVSHQLPIWVSHLSVAGERFWHDPRNRRCALSSITSFERSAGDATEATEAPSRLVEVGYVEPAAGLLAAATDVGAV
ncbi:histidine phosphatase family protein [Leifsonia sp. F6_8S_P_1B]|uniref:Histidine phosphatase family protein n=1 Tax=Leifsonia williamsii TaxID=3035919 RepID=A0ABT8KA34_9MICO|nr:histidine phosphatase family protein [Leifsonia williamsii]MDN4613666.1 histidine phosphatase family protein [Leifsonia williamsii]